VRVPTAIILRKSKHPLYIAMDQWASLLDTISLDEIPTWGTWQEEAKESNSELGSDDSGYLTDETVVDSPTIKPNIEAYAP
jgi:hypothetical protein